MTDSPSSLTSARSEDTPETTDTANATPPTSITFDEIESEYLQNPENGASNITAVTTVDPIEVGFESLDPVQKYAIGTICVILLHRHCQQDMNNIAFARTHSITILDCLNLSKGQQHALLALDYGSAESHDIISECLDLIDDKKLETVRFYTIQRILALLVTNDQGYDARTRSFLSRLAHVFKIDWKQVMTVEMAVALTLYQRQIGVQTTAAILNPNGDEILAHEFTNPFVDDDDETTVDDDDEKKEHLSATSLQQPLPPPSHLQSQPNGNPFLSDSDDDDLEKDNVSSTKAKTNNNTSNSSTKITDVNGTSQLESNQAPSIDQLKSQRRKNKQKIKKAAKIGGITLVGGVLFGLTGGLIAPALLSALAGVGVTSAAGLAASGSLASGAVVGGVFGVAGGGFTLRKARNRISTNIDEFDFERSDDPRVIEARAKKKERELKKEQQRKAKMEKEREDQLNNTREDEQTKELSYSSRPLAITAGPSSASSTSLSSASHSQNKLSDLDLDKKREVGSKKQTSTKSNVFDSDEINDVCESPQDREILETSSNTKRDEFLSKPPALSNGSMNTASSGPKKSTKKDEKVSKKDVKKLGARGLESISTIPSLHICICVPAWLSDKEYGASLDQFEGPLKEELPYSTHLALRWESSRLYEMGLAFAKFWASKATVTTVQQAYPHAVAAASTVAGAVAFAFSIPLTVMSCMDYVDNPWSILVSRSNGAGEELADVLIERSYGKRPVTLFGYSIGARVVFKCLECLAERNMYGIVDNCFLIGAAVTADPEKWKKIRLVVAGRLINGYGTLDWALAFLHRGCGHGVYVAGLRKIELDNVQNVNLAYLGVEGHKELKEGIGRFMKAMGVGSGYISMPPAKLIIRGNKSSVVCEEPGGAEWSRDPKKDLDELDDEDDDEMQVDGEDGFEDFVSKPSEKPIEPERKKKDSKKSKTSKSIWSKWSSSRSSSKSRSNNTSSISNNTNSSNLSNIPQDSVGSSMYSSAPLNNNITTSSTLTKIENPLQKPIEFVDNIADNREGDYKGTVSLAQGVLNDNNNDVPNNATFDWEHQRKIWEEQERQIAETGYAEAGDVIELREKLKNRLMLTISIEVAGRRLERFLHQDEQFPIDETTQVFTNCCDDQEGMNVKVYEHTNENRSVAMNMEKWGKRRKYPRLIEEIDLRLKCKLLKGQARISVALWGDAAGTVHVKVSEEDRGVSSTVPMGGFQNSSVSEIVRSITSDNLCSIEERIELINEEAQRRKTEQMLKEMPKLVTEAGEADTENSNGEKPENGS